MNHRLRAFSIAARISVRWNPKVCSMEAGRPATQIASRASPMAAASVSMCPASARRARLPETNPPTTSTTM